MDDKNNTGSGNTGDSNTGDRNTGDSNTGDSNTGYRNTGDRNTGDRNTGDWNTGDWNTGDCNTGDCNTNRPTVRLFNKDSGLDFFGETHLKFRRIILSYQQYKCIWVHDNIMSSDEKAKNQTYKTTGGYLKVNEITYNGKKVSDEDKKFLESIPNFDAKILEETTGIVFKNTKTITFDGKEIEISAESFEQFKKQFGE